MGIKVEDIVDFVLSRGSIIELSLRRTLHLQNLFEHDTRSVHGLIKNADHYKNFDLHFNWLAMDDYTERLPSIESSIVLPIIAPAILFIKPTTILCLVSQ